MQPLLAGTMTHELQRLFKRVFVDLCGCVQVELSSEVSITAFSLIGAKMFVRVVSTKCVLCMSGTNRSTSLPERLRYTCNIQCKTAETLLAYLVWAQA